VLAVPGHDGIAGRRVSEKPAGSWIGHPPLEPLYTDAMKQPSPGVEVLQVPPEVLGWMAEAVDDLVQGLQALHDPGFLPQGELLDPYEPPYTVPCPTCHAFALELCRHEKRSEPRETWIGFVPGPWPATSRMLRAAHPARHRHWAEHPEYRVSRV